jgi:hypothetical protein
MLGVFAAMFIAMPAPVVSKIFPAIRTPIVAPALMAEPFIVINIVESGSDEKKWPPSPRPPMRTPVAVRPDVHAAREAQHPGVKRKPGCGASSQAPAAQA